MDFSARQYQYCPPKAEVRGSNPFGGASYFKSLRRVSFGKLSPEDNQREAHHNTLEEPPRLRPSSPRAIGAFHQGDDCRNGRARACAIAAPSLAVVGGHDRRHRDADERRAVAEGNARLSRGDARRRDLRRRHRRADTACERNRAARGSRPRRGSACLHRGDKPQILRRAGHRHHRVVASGDHPRESGRLGA
jgi:hypothetical protein